ncbi:arylsulfatase [Prosthecobacter sp.]|uniref:arylsulfatase B n=1 Tax=Prosthecobacter sp. TaxID=1965333 RepID=UPI002ABAD709|nr:arylsulfatase [Prosthecobacter sp.]MDZ4402229.1 arylsulfatase [Prosthecobacter sp.]
MKTVLLSLLFAASAFASDAGRPNIVFLLADDLGRADCGFMGGKDIQTPHLDKLAKAGAILDQFYVQPVCSPTRAALMTGRYPMRHGLQVGVVRPWAEYGLPLEERTLPQALKEAGYQTAIVGKWHLGTFKPDYLPTQRGFDHQYGHYNGALDYFTHIRDDGFDWHRDDKENRDEGYSTHLIAKESVRLIRERDAKKPLFLYVPFNAVHGPYQVPDEYLKPYAQLKGNRQKYAGMLAAMDEAVGQIVAAIDEAGLRKNTLFIFSSDNGGPSPGQITDNGPLRVGKGTLYEGGTRVVAFATWDGVIKPESKVTAALHMVDWYPTLLKLAGASLEQKLPLDGRDAWPAITQGAASPHEFILLNTTPNNGAIRMGDWKLVMGGNITDSEEGGEAKAKKGKKKTAVKAANVELFNLATDPHEKTNLASSNTEKAAELRAKLNELAAQAVPPKSAPKAADFKTPRVWGQAE